MTDQNFTTRFAVAQTPEDVFAAVTNVRGWWSENITGRTDQLGAQFNYRFRDLHRSTIKIVELVPGERVVWHVLSNYFAFTEDETEWTGTKVIFDIARKGDQTELRFTHEGLVPKFECYDTCTAGWGTYVNGSMRDLIVTGKGQPNVGEPMNETERALAVG